MDLQLYYQKIRDVEAKIADEFPIVISIETADGGKNGRNTEVPRRIAAKLVVEGLARVASADEAKAFRSLMAEARRVAEQVEQASKVQLTVLSTADLNRLKGQTRSSKDQADTMALFTDGEVSSIEDLRGYDTQLLEVANIEGIDVTRKLQLAREEISAEVATLLGRAGVGIGQGNVVVTAPLKLWHTFLALELVYRDAYRSQLNDRYAGKRDEYHGMVKWAYDKVIQTGLGIAGDPVERAGSPQVQTCPGSLPDGTYYVAAAWVNAAGAEGANSSPVMIEAAGSSFAVRAQAGPAKVKGWNVYAGTAPQTLTRQNDSPLELEQMWVQPNAMHTSGKPAGGGQAPDYLLPVPRTIQRG